MLWRFATGTNARCPNGSHKRPMPHFASPTQTAAQKGAESLTAIQEVSGLAASIIIDRLNEVDGNPDTEVDDHDEVQGDERDSSWIEWTTMHSSQKRGPNILAGHEDDEDDDPLDHDSAEDEFLTPAHHAFNNAITRGAGCKVSDPGGCEHDGREPDDDLEREQADGDVPVLPVHSLEHNIFSDQRVYLGHSNLLTSFRTNGNEIRSADSGAVLVSLLHRPETSKSGNMEILRRKI